MNSKTLFIVITTFVAIMMAGVGLLGTIGLLNGGEPLLLPYFFIGAMLFIVLIAALVGRYVYLDARTRGMNVWLWVLITMYVPNLIGLLLYIIIRKPQGSYPANHSQPAMQAPSHPCYTCSQIIPDTFEFCPNCGSQQQSHCPSCQTPVIMGWQYCPGCGKRMPHSRQV